MRGNSSQPAGVGFSTEAGKTVNSLSQGAEDFVMFLELFFEAFPALRGRPLHIAGESYAGHYVPYYVARLLEKGTTRVNVYVAPYVS